MSTEQSRGALAKAQAVRRRREAIWQGFKDGSIVLADVLDDPAVANMPVGDLLRKQPRWGWARAGRACRRAGCTVIRRVGDLTERQRTALIEPTPPVRSYPDVITDPVDPPRVGGTDVELPI